MGGAHGVMIPDGAPLERQQGIGQPILHECAKVVRVALPFDDPAKALLPILNGLRELLIEDGMN